MNGDSKALLKKMDTLAEKIDILTQVTAINVQKEKFLKGKKQKEQIEILDKLRARAHLVIKNNHQKSYLSVVTN